MVGIYVRLEQKSRSIGNVFCFKGIVEEIRNEDAIKEAVQNGVELSVYSDSKWINGNKYFIDNEVEEIENLENEAKEKINYADLFDVHWKKRVDAVKGYTSDLKEAEEILQYAKDTDESGSVIEGIEEYLVELRG